MEQLTPPHDCEMASFYQGWPTSFRYTHCSKEAQMTPPSSPLPPARDGPRLQLSRLLRRSKTVKSNSSGSHQDKFRTRPSVTNMRAPFPLILPDSSSLAEDNSTCSPPSSAGLRRMYTSFNDLRGLAQHQVTASPTTPLLPSPITGDFPRASESYFKFHNPREQPATPTSTDESLDSLTILSYHCDDLADDPWKPAAEALEGISSYRETLEDDAQSTASESMPVTPLEQECRPTICTDESDWLANTTSPDERRRRFKSRYYQVVQQPWTETDKDNSDSKVMIATVLVGPGRPKLVQIQRPPSSTRTDVSIESRAVPSTPKRVPLEVSAFSPYDTPFDEPPRIESVMCASTIATPEPSKTLVPQPLAVPRRSRSSRSESIFSTWQRFYSPADPFETSPRRTRSDRSFRAAEKRWAIRSSSQFDLNPFRDPSPTTRSATWLRCRKLERTLTAVTRAIDDFPDDMLQLDSSLLAELRNPQVSAHIYIDALQRIFPSVPSVLASALTAWIIVDLYFARLKTLPVPMERYMAQAAASNEGLYRIPDKVREVLGVGLPDAASIRLNEYALRKRAMAGQASIGVIGQRLVEALRGSWDEDIWRSLKVLVEVIESSPHPWA